jgi:transmembrane 9 superfamily member 2/4
VFRKPDFAVLLCTMCGMGVQVFVSLFFILLFLTVGFISPSTRFFSLYNLFAYMIAGGFLNGYCTGRSMKFFGATEWRFAAGVSSVCLPLYIVAIFLIVDFIEYFESSNQIFPFTSIILFCFLWLVINVPATYYGAHIAFTMTNDQPPLKVNTVRRVIPAQPWYLGDKFAVLLCGFIMFTSVMSEFHFVLTSVWRSQMIGMFFLYFCNINLTLCVVSLVSIILTYLSLQAGNWQWWWRAFWSGFSAGFWILLYCMYHMIVVFQMDVFWSDIVFTLYSLLVSSCFGMMCAFVSVVASWIFVTLLYMQSKSD